MPTHSSAESGTPFRVWTRFWGITSCAAVSMFLGWCALDYGLVKFAPERIHDFDWLLRLFPLAVALVAAVHFRSLGSGRSIAIAFVAALIASVAAVALISVFGVWFHFAIGGRH